MENFKNKGDLAAAEVPIMTNLKDQIVQLICRNAGKKLAEFSCEFARAPPEEKEQILAGIVFERWFVEISAECLDQPEC